MQNETNTYKMECTYSRNIEESIDIIKLEVVSEINGTTYRATAKDGREFLTGKGNLLICTDIDIYDADGNYEYTDTKWHTPQEFIEAH